MKRVQTVNKGVVRVGEVGRRSAAKIAFMAACFHFLSTPQVKQELSGDFLPKQSVIMRGHLTVAIQNVLSVRELRMRSFERGVKERG